jgi:hypothetical protein
LAGLSQGHTLKMKRIVTLIFGFSIFSATMGYGQFLLSGEGIMDVKLGADWDEIEWELGFRGKKIEKSQVGEEVMLLAQNAGIEFDFMISFNHLMWLPVSELLFKDNKVCMIRLSSYPEYNQMISADIGTVEGLNFWDSVAEIKTVYGEYPVIAHGAKSFIVIGDKGLGLGLSDDEVRTMFIFQPQVK